MERDVAIKVIHPDLAEIDEFHQRFLLQAKSAQRLDHRGIIQVYDYGRSDNMLYLSLPLGDNLRHFLNNQRAHNKWIPLDMAIDFVSQICRAVSFLNRNNIFHYDLSPEHIMLLPSTSTPPYRVALTDLGFLKLAEGVTNRFFYAPYYIPPEQALQLEINSRSNVYSLGVLLYELIVGDVPYQISSPMDAYSFFKGDTHHKPSQSFSSLPIELSKIIQKALSTDPNDRFRDAIMFGNDLGKYIPTDQWSGD